METIAGPSVSIKSKLKTELVNITVYGVQYEHKVVNCRFRQLAVFLMFAWIIRRPSVEVQPPTFRSEQVWIGLWGRVRTRAKAGGEKPTCGWGGVGCGGRPGLQGTKWTSLNSPPHEQTNWQNDWLTDWHDGKHYLPATSLTAVTKTLCNKTHAVSILAKQIVLHFEWPRRGQSSCTRSVKHNFWPWPWPNDIFFNPN